MISAVNLSMTSLRAAWLGTVIVVDNVVCSTVHSQLFDFNSGWLYVFGVGVLGGNDITV